MTHEHTTTTRYRPAHRTVRWAVLLTALGVAALTGCGGSGKDTATPDKAAKTVVPAADHSSETSAAASTPPSASTPTPTPTPSADAGTKTPAATPSCDHKMPISPDEVAVYRYTPEGGSLSLIVKSGNWGCPEPDTDGAPFETTGKEYALPLDQAAYITATNPITESSENQHIGVQELLDWLEAHPNSGLVFKYHAGADGAVDKLEQEFTP